MWWRGAIVGAMGGLWLTIGVAWGVSAALTYGFFVVVAGAYTWAAVVAGRWSQQAGRWYHDRQLNGRRRRR